MLCLLITQYSAALTLNWANMPKGISLCYFSSISIKKVKYFNFGAKKKVVFSKVFYVYEVFSQGK